MSFKHFGMFGNEKEQNKVTPEEIQEAHAIQSLTTSKGYKILKHIAEDLSLEYIDRAAAEKDYGLLYGRESLKNLLEKIDEKLEKANRILNQDSQSL